MAAWQSCDVRHFYPRSPCGERLSLLHFQFFGFVISIHALLAESDTYHFMPKIGTLHFYPRSPCGERRRGAIPCYLDNIISIHALLAESDRFYPLETLVILSFLSTLSLRRATQWRRSVKLFRQFLSTLSLRRATIQATPFAV